VVPAPPTGAQHELLAGPYRAVVVSGGGGVRLLTHDGRALLDGYAREALPDGARGQVLAPWPNRLRDGRWRHNGDELQLPVDSAGHAAHGLVRWSTWQAEVHELARVVLTHRLLARPGYPFVLDLRVEYQLDEQDGLTVLLSAVNAGAGPAPVALGMHPYLAAPDGGRVDQCTLQVPARSRLLVDERRIPTGAVPTAGTAHDLRARRRLGDLVLDDAYTDLVPDEDGRVRVRFTTAQGTATELWTDGAARWLQLFTGDTLSPDRRRRGLAVEPMTAPAGALASGDGVLLLAEQQSLALRWGVRAGPPPASDVQAVR
jgi:aldose 1-epimerase